jgi:RHS repeat-associated protein
MKLLVGNKFLLTMGIVVVTAITAWDHAMSLETSPRGLSTPSKSADLPPPMPAGFNIPADPIVKGSNAGYLPGSLEVGSNGQAGYVLPLDVPPGPAGMQPALALNYSSTGGNGILGMGWSVSGSMSAITRCGKTFAIEGEQTGVHFLNDDAAENDADRFCLDGQKLVAVSGDYGASNTEYRTELDTFAKIESLDADSDGPEGFMVWSKNGTISEYRVQRASRHDINVQGVASSETVKFIWLLARQTDRSGNKIDYEYLVDEPDAAGAIAKMGQGIEIVPLRISYSTLDSSTIDLDDRHRFIEFEYERCDGSPSAQCSRPDPSFSWLAGVRVESRKRLQSIAMYGPRPTSKQLLWRYNFTYDTGLVTGRSRLTSVRKCGFLGGCLKAKQFSWSEDIVDFQPMTIEDNFTLTLPDGVHQYDSYATALPPADFDGDGADDFIYEYGGNGNQGYIRLGEVGLPGNTIAPLKRKHLVSDAPGYQDDPNNPNRWIRSLWTSRPVDIDSDGQVELWSGVRPHHLSNGPPDKMGDFFHWDADTEKFVSHSTSGVFDYSHSGYGGIDFTDVNGDGRLDATVSSSIGNFVFPNDGAELINQDGMQLNTTTLGCRTSRTDIDGDGKTDYMSGTPESNCQGNAVILSRSADNGTLANSSNSDGKYPFPPPTLGDLADSEWNEDQERSKEELYYGDFNGDGLDDAALIGWEGNTKQPHPHINIRWNTGFGFGPAFEFTELPVWPSMWKYRDKGLRIADMDGDGRQDFVIFHTMSTSTPWGANYQGITTLYANGARTSLVGEANRIHGEWINGAPLVGDWRFSQLGDFNGDGRIDIVTFRGDGLSEKKLNVLESRLDAASIGTSGSDLLFEVSDELTNWPRERVSFSTYWGNWKREAGRFSNPLYCAYPQACIRPGLTVVRSVESRAHLLDPSPADIDSKARRIEYSYERPRTDLRGRGFLGFELVRKWDKERGAETATVYHHELVAGKYYNAMQPARSQTAVIIDVADRVNGPAWARVVDTKYEYEVHTLNGGRTHVTRPTTSATQEWEEEVIVQWSALDPTVELDGFHIYDFDESVLHPFDNAPRYVESEQTYFDDDFGNVKTQHRKTREGVEEWVEFTYENKVADWLLGLTDTVAVTRTEPNGSSPAVTRHFEYDYDDAGRLHRFHVEKNSLDPDLPLSTEIEYAANGSPALLRQQALVEGVMRIRQIAWNYAQLFPGAPDEHIFASQVWAPLSGGVYSPSAWNVIHPGFGVPVAALDVNGNQSTAIHDDLGRPIERRNPGAKPVFSSYEARSDAAGGFNGMRVLTSQETSPGINQEQVAVTDGLGRSVQQSYKGFSGAKIKTDFVYNGKGQLEAVSRPYTGATATDFSISVYDNLDRPLARWDAAGTMLQYFQHGFFETHVTDAEGNQSYTVADHDGRIIESGNKVPGESSIATHYTYGPFDLLKQIIDAAGNVTQMDYDVLGRRTALNDPDRGLELTSYNGFSQVRHVSHPGSGATMDFSYDGLGRLLSKTSSDDGTDTFTWDTSANGKGRLASTMSAFGVATSHHYDALGRSTGFDYTIDNETYRIDASYDPDYGRPDTLSYPETLPGAPRFTVRNTYTGLGALHHIQNATQGAPATNFWMVNTRNLDQSLTRGVFGNGVVVNWTYDALLGRLTGITADGPAVNGAPALMNLGYEYHANGLVRRRNDSVNGRDEQFAYDSLSRLIDWTLSHGDSTKTWTHHYDVVGNIKEVLLDNTVIEKNNYGNPFGGQPHTLTSRQDPATGLVSMNLYDARGRLHDGLGKNIEYTFFDLPKIVEQGGQTWHLTYDAFGRRAQKKTSGGDFTIYVADIFEKRITDTKIEHIYQLRTDGVQVQIVLDEATGKFSPSYIVKDHLGSNDLITQADGSIAGQRFYSPWGQSIQADGTPLPVTNDTLHEGFTGQEHDGELELINFGGRMYDAQLKRFLTPDPISHPIGTQGLNPYSYVHNSPLNRVDPTGFDSVATTAGSAYFIENGEAVIYSAAPRNRSIQPTNSKPARSDESGYSGRSTGDAPTAREIATRDEIQEAQERYSTEAARLWDSAASPDSPSASPDASSNERNQSLAEVMGGQSLPSDMQSSDEIWYYHPDPIWVPKWGNLYSPPEVVHVDPDLDALIVRVTDTSLATLVRRDARMTRLTDILTGDPVPSDPTSILNWLLARRELRDLASTLEDDVLVMRAIREHLSPLVRRGGSLLVSPSQEAHLMGVLTNNRILQKLEIMQMDAARILRHAEAYYTDGSTLRNDIVPLDSFHR